MSSNSERQEKAKESFKEKAKKVHRGIYNYDKTFYIKSSEKVCITCQVHGDFLQTPSNHLSGQGCPLCKTKRLPSRQTKSFEVFEKEANMLHNNKYTYHKSTFIDCYKKVEITCPVHGSFLQTPSKHLTGQGCKRCAFEKIAKDRLGSLQDFITKAREVHGDTYGYSFVNYKGGKKKVLLECKQHGTFCQTPSDHLAGKGCPRCATYGFCPVESKFLYVVRVVGDICFTGFGITKNPQQRLRTHELALKAINGNLEKSKVFEFENGKQAKELEDMLKLVVTKPSTPTPIKGFVRESCVDSFEDVLQFLVYYKLADIGRQVNTAVARNS